MKLLQNTKLSKLFNQLTLRERMMVFILIVIGIFSIANYWILDPSLKTQENLKKEIIANESQLTEMNSLIAKKTIQLGEDPLDTINTRILLLQKKLNSLNNGGTQRLITLLNPSQMPIVLNEILSLNKKITIDEIRSYKLDKSQFLNDRGNNSIPIFDKQIIEIKIRGDFNSIYNYLVKLETIAEPFYFESLDYQILSDVNAQALIKIYRFSE